MKPSIFALATLTACIVVASPASAALVAYWNFNGLSITTASPPGSGGVPLAIAADQGQPAATVSLSAWAGNVDDFSGSTINVLGSDPAEESLSLVQAASRGNGTYIEVTFSMTGLEDPVVTFATRGTSTGFDTGTWSWSTDGTSFTDVAGVSTATRNTSFALATVDLSGIDDLDGATAVSLRYTLSGAVETGGGNNRIDNLQVNAVPEPGTVAGLASLALLSLLRRRR